MNNSCSTTLATANLIIHTALSCEARVFIDKLHLKKCADQPFTVFCNADRSIFCVVSGIGKVKAASAVTYCHALVGEATKVGYLNLGVAGSMARKIGTLVRVHKLFDPATEETWFPSVQLAKSVEGAECLTTDMPHRYPVKDCVDMEAVGFYQAATLCVVQEQVAILKVISDNVAEQVETLAPNVVIKLIEKQWPQIKAVIDELMELLRAEDKFTIHSPSYTELCQRIHFSQYQQYQLKSLLQRWGIVYPEQDLIRSVAELKSAKHIISHLVKQLDAAKYYWD